MLHLKSHKLNNCLWLFIFVKMKSLYLYIFCCLALVFDCYGQDNFIFNTRHLTVEDGLLGRRVNAMVQDNDGFIWIATNEGLNRFDGYTFEHFTKSTNGLNANNVLNLSKDDEGDIWVSYLRDKVFTPEIQIIRPNTLEILSLQEKLGTQFKEEYKDLSITKGHRNNCIFINNGLISKQYIYKKGNITTVNNALQKIYNEQTDELWSFKEKDSNTIYHINTQGEIITTLDYTFPFETQPIIAATNKGGVFVYGEQNDQPMLYYKGINKQQFQTVKLKEGIKRLNNIFNCFRGDNLLYFEYEGRIVTYDIKDLDARIFRSSIFDNQGNLWLGTNNGVFLLSIKEQRFKQYLKNAGKAGRPYDGRGIWADDAVMFAVSSDYSYQYQFKEKRKRQILQEFAEYAKPISIIESNNNSFWLGTKRSQLLNIDLKTGNLKRTVECSNKQIWALCEDKNNRIWIGQLNRGLYYFDPDKMDKAQKYNQLNGFDKIEKGKIIHIIEDRRNNNLLWLSCQSGWYLLDIEKGIRKRYWSQAAENLKILGDQIQYTYQDDEGIFWLATMYSGLVKVQLSPTYEVLSTQQFAITEGFSSNTIYAIYEDDNDVLWMSTNNGINSFHKKTEDVQVFLEEDGLTHYEFNRLSNFQRADGTIFFGTLNGIVSFHPKELSNKRAYDVPLKITRCEKFSNETERMVNITAEVVANNKIIIEPNERLANLYVSLQNYADALKTKYVYRIKGVQNDFLAANKNEISLSGLPYGTHTLEVKAKVPDGRFSERMISIPLVIARPFYLQWWFMLLSLVSIALTFWQVFQMRTKALKNRKRELEEVVKSRTKQLQEQATQLQLDKNTIEAQAKELRSLDEMKSRFFANISHELRTPLTLILSPISSILKRQKIDNRDFTSAQIVEQNAQKLLKRINEILDLTKLEAREMALQPEPTPFYEFNKRLVATFESLAAQKEQRLTFQYQLDKNLNLLLDQDKYEHIFNNYLSNAIKFTPKAGQIDVQLSEKTIKNSENKTENHIVLSVADNGLGIPPQDLPQVFDRFFQSSDHQNKSGGSGIGLSLSKEIAKLMKGEVRVESNIDEGSIFYFEMPYVEAVDSRQLVVSSKKMNNDNSSLLNFESLVNLTPSENLNKPIILLVEDNPQLRNYIQLILQEKYNVITAENGKEALKRLNACPVLDTRDASLDDGRQTDLPPNPLVPYSSREELSKLSVPPFRGLGGKKPSSDPDRDRESVYRLPSAVISDIMMPEMDGFELLEHLKASDKWRHIPVVMLTARSNIQDKLQALRIGVDDYILKPFQEEELLARIDNLIKNAANRVVVGEMEHKTKVVQSNPIDKKDAQPTISQADIKWLAKAEKRIKEEISNTQFNIESLAAELNISRSQIQRRIKKTTGLSPTKYFREIKLQAAREILENGEVQTVNEVAYAVGFDTTHYFSKLYHQRFGKRPIQYLK